VDFEVRKIQESERQWAESRPILRGLGLILLAVGSFLLVNGLYVGKRLLPTVCTPSV
jgi:hypothetical protein